MAFAWQSPKLGAAAKTSTVQCKSCGGTEFDDFCESGDRACALCGTVLQENGIVSTVQFSESGGTSNVVGQFVSGDRGRPSVSGAGARGRGRFGQSRDSRDITIQNGKKMIMQVLAQLHLRNALAEPASRLFSLCVNQNYVQGRKTMNIVAACVYIVCRQQNYPIMLIDISDKLAVNVYVLGKTFQKLIKYLNLQTAVPIVDPAMYIKRFAAKLDLGSKTNAVCMTALKIIGCMKRDFLATGRQPAGVCCAALTLATRVNRVERSKEEIRKAVRVCGSTVRKRLLEFEATPTSQLTVEELNKLPQDGSFPGLGENAKDGGGGGVGIRDGTAPQSAGDVSVSMREVRMDPPAFIANRIREGQLKMPWSEPILPKSRTNDRKNPKGKAGTGKKPSVETCAATSSSASCAKAKKEKAAPGRNVKSKGLPAGREGVASASGASAIDGDGTGGEDKEEDMSSAERVSSKRGGVAVVGSYSDGRAKGKRKGKGRERMKRQRVLVEGEEEEEEEEDDGEGSDEEDDGEGLDNDDDSDDEDYDDESDNDVDDDDGHPSLKMDMDANTDEGREALTRHVLRVRGKGQRKGSAKRLKVDRQVYSCLTSMFDEDEKQAKQTKEAAPAGTAVSEAGEGSKEGGDTGGGVCNDGGAKDNDNDQGKGGERGGGGDSSSGHEKGVEAAVPAATRQKRGGVVKDGDDSESWDMYLRTAEDEERTKIEWETENKDWLETQEEKNRIQAEEEAKPRFSKKKRKYSTGISSKTGNETFGQVLQNEAAKNKSLKIDHAALQRVMNLDGSFKQIGADDEDSDEPMEEVEEGDPAPQVPLPLHRRGHGFRGGAGRIKNPLTATPTSSSSASASSAASMRPKFLPSKVEAEGWKDLGGGKKPQQQQKEDFGNQEKGATGNTSSLRAAVAGPDDGGEKAIKDVLALLSTGGMDALSGGTGVVAATAAVKMGVATSHAVAKTSATKKKPSGEIEEVELEEVEESAEGGGSGTPGGDAGATGAAKNGNDEEEEEDDEEEEEDDDGGYRGMGGLYNREDYDDDDDPYGEEA